MKFRNFFFGAGIILFLVVFTFFGNSFSNKFTGFVVEASSVEDGFLENSSSLTGEQLIGGGRTSKTLPITAKKIF
jgi:hypothetical protein